MKKKIVILGSTGSIGKNTIDVIRRNKKDFKEFKKLNNKTGTTEESIAQADKLGFKTELFSFYSPLNNCLILQMHHSFI